MFHSPNSPALGLGTAFLGFALFAGHDALIKALGTSYSVFQIIFFAMLFAFIPMALIMLADKSHSNFRPRHPWLVLFRSILNIVAMSSAFYAFTTLPLAEVYSLLFSTPLLITIFSVPLLGEVVRWQRWAAVLIGLVGVVIVLRPGVTELTLGHASALLAAASSGLAALLVRKIGSQERSAVLILYPMLLSMVFMGLSLPAVYRPVALPDLGLMALVGLLSVFAQLCIIGGYRSAPAAVIAPTQYSQIIWATLYGALFFSEEPDLYVGIGSTIIIASGVFVVWRESRKDVSARRPVLRSSNPRFDAGPSPNPSGTYNKT
ncbi:drug/metabolite transporter (DMT)-like permease [Roseibium hamelinense]|uniref:Drug/metabolite transporter (DMT)-like permease n=1 Tax=Roseibium hamelinense TaxID=150831 RepID=A0A562T9T8_9HYPH|nr:DMT family transporter [Roseibium hamelinense]MTI45285.1 DMT family transporter [Roseibium hamelinense]TWI90352.1 drug/metabolite transporter (DMT)-like permease [Roseibium hamelinense]